MSAQPDSVTTLETIEHLDFEPEVPCEVCELRGKQTPLPGVWWLRRPVCVKCGAGPRVFAACDGWWEHFPVGTYTHADCGAVEPIGWLTVLGRIGSVS